MTRRLREESFMEIEKKEYFPAEDGHIESILIGVEKAKVSFQTWDSRELVLLFDNVESILSSHSVYGDIGEFKIIPGKSGLKKYVFYSAWFDENHDEREVLSIEAEKMEIFQVGTAADINSAIFDVGCEYIGGQEFPYN